MTLILPKWISKLVFIPIYILRPELTILPSIYPAFVILGLDNKDTIDGDYYMIDLGTITILLYQEIIYDFVLVFW